MYNPCFTSTYNQPMFSSSYMSHEVINLSTTPYYITLDQDTTIFNQQFQQANSVFSNDHSIVNHKTNNVAAAAHDEHFACHELRASTLQSANDGFINNPKKSKRRRSANSKKINDRHSKINTAQGPRDRRMRLSIDVAKKFFKLQDMLGFDKASKTVEWLLMKSESNIQQLMNIITPHGKPISESSSTSKRELLSENIINDEQIAKSSSSNPSNRKKKKKTGRGVRKSSYLLRPLAKETREMARKRARERTFEKSSKKGYVSDGDDQILKFRPCFDQAMDQGVNCLGSWIINQPERQPSSHFQFKQGIIDENSSLAVIGNSNPSSSFNYQHTGVLNAHHEHDHQFNDFQILGNLWEGCN